MKNTVLDFFEEQVSRHPDKPVFMEKDRSITYKEFKQKSLCVAETLLLKWNPKVKTAVFIGKSIECLLAMFGTLYAGGLYCVLDVKSPEERLRTILVTYNPDVIITETKYAEDIEFVKELGINILLIDDVQKQLEDLEKLELVKRRMIDKDPAYVLFTSGSTGMPKGTVVSHQAIISYAKSVMYDLSLDHTVNFGSQTPFYFSMSVLDIFVTVLAGATLTIIPKMLFSFPVRLIEFLNEKEINTIYWVPTAMCIVANRDTFSEVKPNKLKNIFFAGEVMPVKQLNYWIKNLPGKVYANLYGPTEITDTGTYYIVNREFSDSESLPIGVPFSNCDVLLLNEHDRPVVDGEGEICFRGSFLGYGYYNNPDKTAQAFCQNPINTSYPELIYRTGDIGKYNEFGELLYISRKDFQIKKSGYRIELGEIEASMSASDGIQAVVCVYNQESQKIVLFYTGNAGEAEVRNYAEQRLVRYMVPDEVIQLKTIPINANGKYDRKKLLKNYKEGKNV